MTCSDKHSLGGKKHPNTSRRFSFITLVKCQVSGLEWNAVLWSCLLHSSVDLLSVTCVAFTASAVEETFISWCRNEITFPSCKASAILHIFAQSVCVKLASPQAARLGIFDFDFNVSDWTMQVVTHKSKIKIMPYNSVQMIDSTLSFDLLLPRGTLMTKTLHQSRILCMLLSVIEAYDHFL